MALCYDVDAMLDALADDPPDIALIAVSPHREALEAVHHIRTRWPAVKIAMLGDAPAPDSAEFAVFQEIDGELLTPSPGADRSLDSLSSRQRQVLEMVGAGASNEEIAERLFISVNTVKFHLRSIYARLDIHNRVQAARVLSGMRPGGRRASDRLLDH